MKIRNRITYTFTGLATFIVVLIGFIIYFSSDKARENIFFQRLEDRANITEKFFLEAENESSESAKNIKEKFAQKLPEEFELALKSRIFIDSLKKSNLAFIPDFSLIEIQEKGEVYFNDNNYQGIIKRYDVNNEEYLVLVAAKDEYGLKQINQLILIIVILSLFSILLSFIVSRMLVKQILKPIAVKIEKANNITVNNLSERLHVYNNKDEIGKLAIAFNNLLNRLEDAFTLQKNFVRYASHEIKNPLAAIMGEIEVLLTKERSKNEYILTFEKINKEANRLNLLVNNFLQLPQSKKGLMTEEVYLDELLFEIISEKKQEFSAIEIELNIDEHILAEDIVISGDKELLKRAFSNIIDNGLKFSDYKPIKINIRKASQGINLEFNDNGIGIPQEELNMVFEPLFRSKNAVDIPGTGMGLSIVKTIIENHNGTLSIKNITNGKGCQVSIRF